MPNDFDPSELPFDEAITQFRQHGFAFIQQHGPTEGFPQRPNSKIAFIRDEFFDIIDN
jgi:hypothetical protein